MAFARPILPLFRPIATPRPAAISQIHRFSHCARLNQQAAVTTAPVDANAPPAEQAQPTLLPYFVQRTPSNNLPVYKDTKRGGNLKVTRVRKISGNVNVLCKQLRTFLDLSEKEIIVNRITQHIVVKGDHYSKIVEFLEAKRF